MTSLTIDSDGFARLKTWDGAGSGLSSLRSYVQEMETHLDQVFGRLDHWCQELRQFEESLGQEQLQLEQQRQAFAQSQQQTTTELDAESSRMTDLITQIDQLTAQLNERDAAFTQSQDDVEQLETLRQQLETELERVRARATELTDSLNQAEQQHAEERAKWTGELEQMRRILDAETAIQQPVADEPSDDNRVTLARQAEAKPAENTPENHVVGGVRAQFQKLSNQRNKRARLK